MSFNKTKIAILISASFCLNMPTMSAFAQDQTSSDTEEVEKISVTGSRIARANLVQATPVTSVSADDIEKSGTFDLGTVLAELPAIGGTSTASGNANNNGLAGLSLADLRRLDSSRTLTLVDGKRHVGSDAGTSVVDLNSIPAGLVQSVDIITGGASAIYGSDAVSGVVNVILKKDFEGLEFDARGQTSTQGGFGKNHSFSILGGGNFADDKGNATFSLSHARTGRTRSTDLQQSGFYGTVNNPESIGEEDGIPDLLFVPNVGSEWIHRNGVLINNGPQYGFNDDGTPVRQQSREFTNSFAFGNFPNGCETCFFGDNYVDVLPEQNRVTAFGTFNYDITDNVSFNSSVKYVLSNIEQSFQPAFRFTGGGGISVNVQDNPFLDPVLRQELIEQGASSVGVNRFLADERGEGRNADNRRTTFRLTSGFEGLFDLGGTFVEWETYYIYGETNNTIGQQNAIILGNLSAAVDSVIDPNTGLAACRQDVPSAQGEGYESPETVSRTGRACLPYNPFGNQNSREVLDYVYNTSLSTEEVTQEVFGGSFNFDTGEFFELPGGAIGFAGGYEYRKETSFSTFDRIAQAGFTQQAASPDQGGEFDVEEVFAEVFVPILMGESFAEELSLDAAVREADYSHSGSATAWKVGLIYSPIEDVRFRATLSEAVRAPNIDEAFRPQSPGFGRVADPCDEDNIDDNPNRRANCAAIGAPTNFQANDNVSVGTITGGNPDLLPESSESLTYGVVYTPSFINDFSITLDFYDIEIVDAIDQVLVQRIVDNCVDSASGPDAGFCDLIERDPNTFDVDTVQSTFINTSKLTTKGVDFEVAYLHDISQYDFGANGSLRFRLQGNYLDELNRFEFQNVPDEVNVERGERGDPKVSFITNVDYIGEGWTVGWRGRFLDSQALIALGPDEDIPEDRSPAFTGSYMTHDLNFSYDLGDHIIVNGGVRNVGNRLPPTNLLGDGINDNIFDFLGRRVYAGIKISL
ncbi:TonB-dependent receptor domain-containing protein [Agaribacter marinus]|uniref:TonB-dependent receptor n=1 Tax=Agaribacter marinus TaxID=1431249 RepID=A0AA37WK65_9ALTE|nr:TonB-dependent receptor [Agaribacter marinus]GLR70655.1 TonB-dependent receptor [Agaribacter marinus]